MTTRARAIALCRAAAADPLYMKGHYAEFVMRLGYRVRHVRGRRGTAQADYEGADMAAVEFASSAWLAVDPEPLGIEDVHDGRRDTAAAQLLEQGWNP